MTTKKCKKCLEHFKPYNTIQKHCFKCALELAKSKAKSNERKAWTKRKTKIRDSLKTKTQKINEARTIYQQYIRARDKTKPCISCETTTATKWDAGHYLKAELYTGLIFNEDNCHKQCQRCNQYGGGMQAEYRIGLVKRLGQTKVEYLESIKDSLRVYKWEDSELEELKKKYKNLLKQFGG